MKWNIRKDKKKGHLKLHSAYIRTAKNVDLEKSGLRSALKKLDERSVPKSYTAKLDEIYLTYLKNDTLGLYSDCCITLSCCKVAIGSMERTLIHEIGHHIDYMNDISSSNELYEEWELCHPYVYVDDEPFNSDKYITEYVALGFEKYYFGDIKDMVRTTPVLFKEINKIHNKYRKLSR